MNKKAKTVAELRDWLAFASPEAEVLVQLPEKFSKAKPNKLLNLSSFAQFGSTCELAVEDDRLSVEYQVIKGEAKASLLARENGLVVTVSEALLGAISNNFRRVSVEVQENEVVIHFLLAEDRVTDREEIKEIEFYIDNGCVGQETIQTLIHISEDLKYSGPPGRRVFSRKEINNHEQ